MSVFYEVIGEIHLRSGTNIECLTEVLGDIDYNVDASDDWTTININGGCYTSHENVNEIDDALRSLSKFSVAPGGVHTWYSDKDDEFIYVGPPTNEKETISSEEFGRIRRCEFDRLTQDDIIELIVELSSRLDVDHLVRLHDELQVIRRK